MLRLILSAVAALTLVGCGVEEAENAAVKGEVIASSADAERLASSLVAAGLPVVDLIVVTEKSETNDLLGRPGQYTSKVFFVDERHPGEGADPTAQNSIEVFETEESAFKRKSYVEAVTADAPLLQQYIFHSGRAVLRLDRAILPSEAKSYESAFAKVAA